MKYSQKKLVQIPKYINSFRTFKKFSNFGAKDLCGFWNVDAFSARFSGRAWKMLKNAALDAKIGVDTVENDLETDNKSRPIYRESDSRNMMH